jgi:hypothetical protein
VIASLHHSSSSSRHKGSKVCVVDGGESTDAQEFGSSLTLFNGS